MQSLVTCTSGLYAPTCNQTPSSSATVSCAHQLMLRKSLLHRHQPACTTQATPLATQWLGPPCKHRPVCQPLQSRSQSSNNPGVQHRASHRTLPACNLHTTCTDCTHVHSRASSPCTMYQLVLHRSQKLHRSAITTTSLVTLQLTCSSHVFSNHMLTQ